MERIEETFAEALEFTAQITPQSFPNLTRHLDPDWVEEALLATGTATLRRRRMPAEQTVWLVLGMAVMRDLPITTVAQRLEIALPARDGPDRCVERVIASTRTSRA